MKNDANKIIEAVRRAREAKENPPRIENVLAAARRAAQQEKQK